MVEKIQQQQQDQKKVINKNRSINKIINSLKTTEGDGFLVNRSFPTDSVSYIDPFLLLDEMGPMDFKPGEAKGAPDHPHRGFETVTYLIEGIFEHKDSSGNSGKLLPGDTQWMTAGSGVIHSEMPETEFSKKGGRLHGFQLWVNLPQKDKMTNPYYQDISSSEIPVVKLLEDGGYVKVIAGRAFDVESPIRTKIPIQYLHFTLNPGSEIIHHLQGNYNAFVYVISGEGTFGDDEKYVKRGNVIIFNNDGENIKIKSSKDANEPLQFLFIAGVPLNEPVARYGPFVMNTKQEIYQAMEDYRNGKLGVITH
ncbi:MAG TPA: pirin family protein [Candidatus Nitrosocosmicus sp.]|jgi:quercetin 2,3-dioxygenase|nr:pirin family protein [Candidatus Nitrosocosmicus sp.]